MPILARLAAACCLSLLPLSAAAAEATLSGTAFYRERIALPPNAVFAAVLQDTSRQDVPAVEMGRAVLDPAGHPPYRFTIPYDPDLIRENHTYTVRASISVGEQLRFTTDTAHPVLTGGAGDSVEILMKMVAAKDEGTGPVQKPARFTGLFRYMADAAIFQECRTGQGWPVAMEKDFPRLERAYRNVAAEPGAPARLSAWATVEPRPKMDGEGTEPTLIVHRTDQITGDQTCPEPQPDASLTNTYWRLISTGEYDVGVVEDGKEPHLLLEADRSRYRATAGCNGLGGEYVLVEDKRSLTLKPGISTMMACPPPVGLWEGSLKHALSQTASWSVDGVILTLLNRDGETVATFRAVYLQ
jgi:uncharacterized lipoprotein YbaY/heat shock protein HslJ